MSDPEQLKPVEASIAEEISRRSELERGIGMYEEMLRQAERTPHPIPGVPAEKLQQFRDLLEKLKAELAALTKPS